MNIFKKEKLMKIRVKLGDIPKELWPELNIFCVKNGLGKEIIVCLHHMPPDTPKEILKDLAEITGAVL